MKDKSYLRALIDYNAWANAETYRLVAEMPPEEVTKKRKTPLVSIFVSLNHLLNVDRIWMAHMQGQEHSIGGLREVQYESLDDLWQARQEMDRTLQDYVDSLSEDALEEIVDYELIGGNKGSLSRAMCLTHLARRLSPWLDLRHVRPGRMPTAEYRYSGLRTRAARARGRPATVAPTARPLLRRSGGRCGSYSRALTPADCHCDTRKNMRLGEKIMAIPVHKPTRDDILKCVARFDDITPADGGLPDQEMDGYRRTFYNALGFSQPAGDGAYSPVGNVAKPLINHLTPGFNLAYVEARPSQGVMMHTHDTNETFVVIAGTWKFEWEGDQGDDHVVLNERDVVSFEPGSQRRFECVSAPEGTEKGMILGVIGGDTPAAEFSPESIEKMRAAGVEVQQAAE